MPRRSLGPRLYFDENRQNWVIRDGHRFIRTGATGWRTAQERLNEYMKTRPVNLPPPAEPAMGYVYFVTADHPDFPIKIGFTQRADATRSKDLQTGCPYPVKVLALFPGTYSDERKLHRQFADQRLQGEWFARSDELIALIDEKRKA